MRYAVAQARWLNAQMVLNGIRMRQAVEIPQLRFDQTARDYACSPAPRDRSAISGASATAAGPVPPDSGGHHNSAEIDALISRGRATGWFATGRQAPDEGAHGHP